MSSAAGSAWSVGAGKFAESGVGMVAFGTVMGGAGASLTGGNFWQGAATGLVVSGLNHAAHIYQTDPIRELANRIAKQWQRDDANEIYYWLKKHPFIVDGDYNLKFKDIEMVKINVAPEGVSKTDELTSKGGKWLINQVAKKIISKFISGGNFLMFDGGLSKYDQPKLKLPFDPKVNSLKRFAGEKTLLDFMFTPRGTQVPSMKNGFRSYQKNSNYDFGYKHM